MSRVTARDRRDGLCPFIYEGQLKVHDHLTRQTPPRLLNQAHDDLLFASDSWGQQDDVEQGPPRHNRFDPVSFVEEARTLRDESPPSLDNKSGPL